MREDLCRRKKKNDTEKKFEDLAGDGSFFARDEEHCERCRKVCSE